MLYSEKNFIKLLEYDQMDSYNAYNSMALILGLEFYSEPDKFVYSICSHAFLLDINDESCSLIFVDEKINDQKYKKQVETYFNEFLANKLVFYYLLKFFTKIIDLDLSTNIHNNSDLFTNTDNKLEISTVCGDLQSYKTMCKCIYSGNYCFKNKIPMIPDYNIFTHRYDILFKNPFMAVEITNNNYILENNLSLYFSGKELTVELLKKLSTYFFESGDTCIKGNNASINGGKNKIARIMKSYFFESGDTSINGKNVCINGKKNKIASFLFKKGLSLDKSIIYAKKFAEK